MQQDKEKRYVPLAERMRPTSLDKFYGQDHLIGKGKILTQLIESGQLISLIFWGPPGSGKTTLGFILADHFKLPCKFFSAVLSGIKEIKEFMKEAESHKAMYGNPTVIFIDEIHRFNKAQQGAFLPYTERGDVILFGATTENPSFEVIAPLLSRTKVLVLNPLSDETLKRIIREALLDEKKGVKKPSLKIDEEALQMIVDYSNGDARRALNSLEISANLADKGIITAELVKEALQRRVLIYDKSGEEHFNLISALHKSMRNSDVDASLYWLARMLFGGEDPLYILRRLVRFAVEDIGLADPQAMAVALHAKETYEFIGSPEGDLALAETVIYLASAPKSNRVYSAFNRVMKEVKDSPQEPVPLQLRNAPTRLMQEAGYGQGYQYAHDHESLTTVMGTLPDKLQGKRYYFPGNLGFEKEIQKRMDWWQSIKDKIRRENSESQSKNRKKT